MIALVFVELFCQGSVIIHLVGLVFEKVDLKILQVIHSN